MKLKLRFIADKIREHRKIHFGKEPNAVIISECLDFAADLIESLDKHNVAIVKTWYTEPDYYKQDRYKEDTIECSSTQECRSCVHCYVCRMTNTHKAENYSGCDFFLPYLKPAVPLQPLPDSVSYRLAWNEAVAAHKLLSQIQSEYDTQEHSVSGLLEE